VFFGHHSFGQTVPWSNMFEEKTAFCVVSVVEIFEVDEFLEKKASK